MVTAHIVGFSQEEGIRLAAFLAQRGVYAEPVSEVQSTAGVDAVFVYGNARNLILKAMEVWGGSEPAYAVVFIYPLDDMPLDGASVFPPWIDAVTRSGLEDYLEEAFHIEREEATRPTPLTVGYTQRKGSGGIARVEVLGPSGVIFETADRVQRAVDVTFYIPLGRRKPIAMRGTVVSRRFRFRGRSRCVVSFMAVPGAQRRALGCLLAGYR